MILLFCSAGIFLSPAIEKTQFILYHKPAENASRRQSPTRQSLIKLELMIRRDFRIGNTAQSRRCRYAVRLYRNGAAGLTPGKMTENMQADALPSCQPGSGRQAGFVRCCLYIFNPPRLPCKALCEVYENAQPVSKSAYCLLKELASKCRTPLFLPTCFFRSCVL